MNPLFAMILFMRIVLFCGAGIPPDPRINKPGGEDE